MNRMISNKVNFPKMTHIFYATHIKIKMTFQGIHHYSQTYMEDQKARNSQTSNKG